MTIVPMYKKCPKCYKKYSWNPDVGKFNCPYCGGLRKPKSGGMGKMFNKTKKTDK